MTNEQLRGIINNAPEGATHVDAELDYWKALSENECILMTALYSSTIGKQYPLRSLADLREILGLREENEQLRDENQAMKDILRDAIGLMRSNGVTSGWHQVANVAESLVNSELTTEKESQAVKGSYGR